LSFFVILFHISLEDINSRVPTIAPLSLLN
jgi:hypothetical protein